jgi:hypothetical protein
MTTAHPSFVSRLEAYYFYAFFMNSDTFVTVVGSRLSVIQTNALERSYGWWNCDRSLVAMLTL